MRQWGAARMGFIAGDTRTQGTLFPVTLEEMIPGDHFCRVIDAFVNRLDMQRMGFVRAEAAETGRPGYDPRDLLKLYLYGYLQQIRHLSRKLCLEESRSGLKAGLEHGVDLGQGGADGTTGTTPALLF
jgi:hypothetical protein